MLHWMSPLIPAYASDVQTSLALALPALLLCVPPGGLLTLMTAEAGLTVRVSVASSGVQGNGPSLFLSSVSADGRFVAFSSDAENLVPGDTNHSRDVFVHDRDADGDGVFDEPGAIVTRRVSVASTGAQGNGYSYGSSVSADGRVVAFRSSATNLVPGDTNGTWDVFVHDRLGIVEAVCAGFAATILGTPGPDQLVGTPGPDVIHGRHGQRSPVWARR